MLLIKTNKLELQFNTPSGDIRSRFNPHLIVELETDA